MLKQFAGMERRGLMLSFMGVVITTFVASANALAGYDAHPIPVAYEEPQGAVRDDPVPTTEEDAARPLNVPAQPAGPNNPSRRCGNVGNLMLDIDDLCQYAGPMRAASATIVGRQ